MGRLSDSLANAVLDHIFAGTAIAALPATFHVALSTTAPTNTGTNVTEPVGGAYVRATIARSNAAFGAATGRVIDNDVAITFPAPSGNWGTVTHFALYTATTGGTFLGWGALASAVTVNSGGSAPTIPIGGLVIPAPGA